MLNMLAEKTKISPSIPLIVALIASAVGFGAQYVLYWKCSLTPLAGIVSGTNYLL